MAIRKMVIPFKNFLKNTVISSTQMNDNLAEIEYAFNELYNAHNERVSDTYSKEEVDNLQTNMDGKLIDMITESHLDNENSSMNVYNAMEHLTDEEVSDSSLNGILNPLSDGFISDSEIAEIIGLKGSFVNNLDMGQFAEESPITLDGGEF